MERLELAFTLAAGGEQAVATLFPSLATLLGAKKAIAQKGASTKRMNKQAIAEGREPTHGKVGRKRRKAAEKAAYAGATTPWPLGCDRRLPPAAAPVASRARRDGRRTPAAPVATNGTGQRQWLGDGSLPGRRHARLPARPRLRVRRIR